MDYVAELILACWLLLNTSLCAQHTVRPNKPKYQSLEQRKVDGRAKQGVWVAHPQEPETPWWFKGRFLQAKFVGEGCRVCDFLVIGWWWGNRAVLQECCVQPEVTILHLIGGLSSCRRTRRYCYIYSLSRNQDPALIAALLFLDCSSFVSAFPHFSD